MADKQPNGSESLYAMDLLREGRRGVGRKTGRTEQEQEDRADLRIAEERLQAIREGRTKVISGCCLRQGTSENL